MTVLPWTSTQISVSFAREYGNGIGISSCGFIDENDEEFRRECYFPYFSGSGVSSYADIAVEQKASSPTYIGVCEDVKLGCSIIFHIQNGMEYIKEATLGGLNKSSISITFSGLALSGKILLPVAKDAGAADKRAKRSPQPDDAYERSKGRESRCH